jgi:predicted RNA-binding Zn ribbon-like protein
MSAQHFDFEGGALGLDFANTAEWHASQEPHERLNDIADLVAWGVAARVLDARQGRAAARWAEEAPAEAAAEFERALDLREAIYRIFAALSAGGQVASWDLATLNESLSQAMAQAAVTPAGEGFGWSWEAAGQELVLIRWSVARSAAELLTGGRLDRVRQCADDRGCGYLFFDSSRNGSRRWCSMETCGNRAKAKRHYAKSAE